MQRNIKFRAWHKNFKSMCPNITTDLLNRNYLVFMEYTGINDINNIEIYEDDLICQTSCINKNKFIGQVKFHQGSWWIDNGIEKKLLYNPNCKNTVTGNYYEDKFLDTN